ncbi:unnamed protein product [Hymenolepis diminuta]|uniref:ATP-synt_ab_C domain-containing protein n=1 Tax=Hymenolepis diminuta TaxID=6216 RepID=A0A0R3SN74_HYMDI|nr:unnamed protein product [Hymenolepis diminuta]
MYLLGNKSSSITQITETLRCYGAMDYTITVVASSADSAPMQSFAPFAGVAIDGQIFPETNLFNAGIKPPVNVKNSVSGIVEFGQIPRMKKVAVHAKATSKKSLAGGRKNQELFKQSLHDSMLVEEQIALLYIGISGYLGIIPPDQVSSFEKQFLELLRSKLEDIKTRQWNEMFTEETEEI